MIESKRYDLTEYGSTAVVYDGKILFFEHLNHIGGRILVAGPFKEILSRQAAQQAKKDKCQPFIRGEPTPKSFQFF